ncbi:ASPIC and UnbV [Rubripirellula tenax]|uniref:ASPIC and UnbV n=1 Tax=Rubripirellula tenax TaxID=2528015 RepID=A0A5C6ER65_9BACT|nr:FG-GAP-like repeat-containing protein [Rubripirellula tenax]TWU50800.1 ASPIC and UnbV [Rubripirellula tenax]
MRRFKSVSAFIVVMVFAQGCQREIASTSSPKPTPPASMVESDRVAPDTIADTARYNDITKARTTARARMIASPNDASARLAAAEVELADGQFPQVIELARGVPKGNSSFNLAQELISDAAIALNDDIAFDADVAWAAMEHLLTMEPNRHDVRHRLVRLLNRRGYRHRACQHVHALCRLGLATEDELRSLIHRRDSYPPSRNYDVEQASDMSPASQRLALARYQHTHRRDHEAYQTLEPEQRGGWTHPEHAALFGAVLAESQQLEDIPAWLNSCPKNADRYSEYWSAVGAFLIEQRQPRMAAGALFQAIEIDPTSDVDYKRLAVCGLSLGDSEAGKIDSRASIERALLIDRTRELALATTSQAEITEFQNELTVQWLKLGLPLEYLQWSQIHSADKPDLIVRIARERNKLLSQSDFATRSADEATLGMNRNPFPPPTREQVLAFATTTPKTKVISNANDAAQVRFIDVAVQTGLTFEYYNAPTKVEKYFRLHETLGGGIAVIDFDLDGKPDVYLGQGSGEPPHTLGKLSDRLFRNGGRKFTDVTSDAKAVDFGYTTGLAVGDLNQDGWPDLVVGALGSNRILINQGDGSFIDGSDWISDATPMYTSSIAIADVTGDRLPDVVEANYVDDPAVFQRRAPPNDGIPFNVSPTIYQNAIDRFFISTGRNRFTIESLDQDTETGGSSLGVVVTDIDSKPGNEVLIANDSWPNHYWVWPDTGSTPQQKAVISGIALDNSGTATAGMGIASGDFDHDGELDFHMTNFSRQSSSLYIQNSTGSFTDIAARLGLTAATFPMLGFGTQAIDADQDGTLDLFILNGHIDDYSVIDQPFRMRPQFFRGVSNGFELQATDDDDSGYGQVETLGRVLAKLDWNGDGKTDLIANHLDAPIALLENQTSSTAHWVSFRLVGTESERDAIGGRVTVSAGSTSSHQWQTAGDGYLCSNERVLDFGLEKDAAIDEVIVRWPTGTLQTFTDIAVDRRYVLVEGQSSFVLD